MHDQDIVQEIQAFTSLSFILIDFFKLISGPRINSRDQSNCLLVKGDKVKLCVD